MKFHDAFGKISSNSGASILILIILGIKLYSFIYRILKIGTKLFSVNLGNVKAFLSRSNEIIPLTVPQGPVLQNLRKNKIKLWIKDRIDEKKRIESNGGHIQMNRINVFTNNF